MTPREIVIGQHKMSQMLYGLASKDMSDDDARFQPFKGANHLNWILTHLAVSEDSMTAKIAGTPKRYSETLHKQFGGGSVCTPDDGMTKAEAWKMYTESAQKTIDFITSFPESRYDEPSPENFRQMAPTLGGVVALLASHPFWHFGQLTGDRKALGKPSIFG